MEWHGIEENKLRGARSAARKATKFHLREVKGSSATVTGR
jgi:hypothetical protein